MTQKFARSVLSVAVIALLIWLSLRFLLPIAAPFFLGLYLALTAEPATRLLQSRLKLPRKAASALSVSAVFLLTATLLTILAGLLMGQLGRLRDVLPQLEAAAKQALALLQGWLQALAEKLPAGLHATVDRALADFFSGGGLLGEKLIEKLSQMAAGLVGRLSSGLFGLLTGIISGYMLAGRLDTIKAWLCTHLPESWRQTYLPACRQMRASLGGWLLAELKLAGVAFVLLFLGFWILGIENKLVLSWLITIVDAFPVLGVGTVLIPWSILCFLQENYAQGMGILGLYGVIWLTRSVLEPRLVGKGLGLDPLVTLVTIYAGWRLFGIVGMLLSPILAMMATQITKTLRK